MISLPCGLMRFSRPPIIPSAYVMLLLLSSLFLRSIKKGVADNSAAIHH